MALRLSVDELGTHSHTSNPNLHQQSPTLPTDIIYYLTSFTGPIELFYLRAVQWTSLSCLTLDYSRPPVCSQVSKQFHAIANDLTVWRTKYQNARLPRPPGPFPWQSLRFLQRTLVRSARLAQTWTTQPLKIVSSRQVNEKNGLWASKRWLIVGRESELVSYDIDTGFQQTLWESKSITYWVVCSIVSARGHLIYLVVREGRGDKHDTIKLLEFEADDDSGRLLGPIIIDVPLPCVQMRWTYLHALSTNVPFVYITADPSEAVEDYPGQVVIFDVRTRIFYKFPGLTSQLYESQLVDKGPVEVKVLLASTHIIVIYNIYFEDYTDATVTQAFVVPNDPHPSSDGIPELRLSHEMIHEGASRPSHTLLRDSVINHIDGSTTLSLMSSAWLRSELSLPRSQDDGIARMSSQETQILNMEGYYDVSSFDNGFVRALCKFINGGLARFMIDASGESVVIDFLPSSPVTGGVDFFDRGSEIHWFDGVRGRICYSKPREDREGDGSGRVFVIVGLE